MRVELGIADHIWMDKREAIAQTVDSLGAEFKPAMRAGWMGYIRQAYPDGADDVRHNIGQDQLVLDDDEWDRDLAAHGYVYSQIPSCGWAIWPAFCNEYAPKSQFRVLK